MTIKTAIILLLIFLGILLFAKNSQAVSYYVKNGGNDNAAGTSDATAWARAPGMVGWAGSKTLQSGDIVYFRSQDTWSTSSGDELLTTITAGVTYVGNGWGTGTRAKFMASGALGEAIVTIYASNVTFRGFEVDGNTQNSGGIYVNYPSPTQNISNITIDDSVVHHIGGSNSYYYGIGVEPIGGRTVTNVSILNTKVYNTVHEGITLYPSWQNNGNIIDTVTIRGNEVYNTGQNDGDNGHTYGQGILIKDDVRNAIIEFNSLHDNPAEGFQVEQNQPGYPMPAPTNITFRYNILKDNGMWGTIFLGQSQVSTVDLYGNIYINNGKAGASEGGAIFWAGQNFSTSVFKFYNNTIYQATNGASSKNGINLSGSASGNFTIDFKNNLVYSNVIGVIPIIDGLNRMTHSNNLVFNGQGTSATHVVSGSTSYNRSGVLTWEPSAQNTDPTFKNSSNLPTGFTGTYGSSMVPNTDGLSISSGNAIDRGVTLASPYNGAINLSGKGQARSGSFDIGAYEYVSDSSPPDTTPPAPPTGVQIQ